MWSFQVCSHVTRYVACAWYKNGLQKIHKKKHAIASQPYATSHNKGLQHHINIRISHSSSRSQYKEDARNHVSQEPYFGIPCGSYHVIYSILYHTRLGSVCFCGLFDPGWSQCLSALSVLQKLPAKAAPDFGLFAWSYVGRCICICIYVHIKYYGHIFVYIYI